MRVIVQIPCFNEAETLAATLADIPRSIPGVDRVEVLVVDDGSTDGSAEIARRSGADHVVRHLRNQGLARAFRTGLDTALALGADIVVNTDADHQYPGASIPDLVRPILDGRADLVLGDRRPHALAHFSLGKRLLQRLGSLVVRRLAGVEAPDAVTGFRALSRDAALRLNIHSSFSYTIETLIQAGQAKMAVISVPVPARATARASRLFHSVPEFILQSAVTTVRTYTMYKPLRVFATLGLAVFLAGSWPAARFLLFYFRGEGGGHVQSLVLGGVLMVLGFASGLLGLLADLIAVNRSLLEQVLEKTRRAETAPRGGDEDCA